MLELFLLSGIFVQFEFVNSMKPKIILLSFILASCGSPKLETPIPDQSKLNGATTSLLEKVSGFVYGAKLANDQQPSSNAQKVVNGELEGAKEGLPPPTKEGKEAAEKRIDAGIAGNLAAYQQQANEQAEKIRESALEVRRLSDENIRLREERDQIQKDKERLIELHTSESIKMVLVWVGGILVLMGAIAGAVSVYAGKSPLGGVFLGLFGLGVSTLAFLLGSPIFNTIVVIVAVLLIGTLYIYIKDWIRTKQELKKGKILEVVASSLDKVPRDILDPALTQLSKDMNRDEKLLIKTLRKERSV